LTAEQYSEATRAGRYLEEAVGKLTKRHTTTMNTERNYIYDLGQELVLLAERIKSESQGDDDPFQHGRRFAIYEVLSLMNQQAEAFGLTANQIGLEGFDIENLLE
jgi:hypothetical protein